MLNLTLGRYIAFAHHDPQRYPQKPFLTDEAQHSRDMSDDEMHLRGKMIARAYGKVNENGKNIGRATGINQHKR